jgi:hypothetical protein
MSNHLCQTAGIMKNGIDCSKDREQRVFELIHQKVASPEEQQLVDAELQEIFRQLSPAETENIAWKLGQWAWALLAVKSVDSTNLPPHAKN